MTVRPPISLSIGSVRLPKQYGFPVWAKVPGTRGAAKMTSLVVPLANSVDDTRLREALHRVHGVAPESVRPPGDPGGLTRGIGDGGVASAGRLTRYQSITGSHN